MAPLYFMVIQDELYLLFEQKSQFWRKFSNSNFAPLCQHETLHTKVNCLKIIDFSLKNEYENCMGFKFGDVTLSYISEAVLI